MNGGPLYGILAEFDGPEPLLEAARATRAAGYERIDAYTPLPVEGLAAAIGFHRSRLPLLVLIGGVIGAACGYGLQYYTTVVSYPINVGGRPLHSWPSFMPVTFEMTVLVAALFAVLGMLALNGLPRPHHPLFEVPQFAGATRDRFFLCIESRDGQFHAAQTRRFLKSLHPLEVIDVPEVP